MTRMLMEYIALIKKARAEMPRVSLRDARAQADRMRKTRNGGKNERH